MAALWSSQHRRRHHQPANIDHHHHQATSPQPQQQAPPFLQSPPLYRMSRGIKTITDLYREWYDGFAGGYPIETLERLWELNGGKIKKNEDSQTGADYSLPPSRTLPSSSTSPSKPLPLSPKKDAPGSTRLYTISPNIMTENSNTNMYSF